MGVRGSCQMNTMIGWGMEVQPSSNRIMMGFRGTFILVHGLPPNQGQDNQSHKE